jgi:uncharacterized membrane protein
MYEEMTTLGLSERIESVLAYSLGWVSGLILFIFEKNRTVRWHAAQSMITFGTLSLLTFGVGMLRNLFSLIPFLGWFTSFGLNLLLYICGWAGLVLWIWLMVMAWVKPDYRLPIISKWVSYFV